MDISGQHHVQCNLLLKTVAIIHPTGGWIVPTTGLEMRKRKQCVNDRHLFNSESPVVQALA